MSKINVNTWEPESSTALTMGASGDTTTVPSGASLVVASGATINITGATQTGFPSAGFSKYTVVVASDATFDLQSGTTKLIIEVQASGGNSGSSGGGGYNGGSGGGGAYARKFLSPMVDTDTLNITIGAVPGIGVSGTTTSVASASGTAFTTISCVGGAGGTSYSGTTQGVGGAGGTLPTTGDFNIGGGGGTNGAVGLSNQSGGSFYGIINQRMVDTAGSGVGPIGYGGGGNASYSSGTGGTGGAAVVIVWEYK